MEQIELIAFALLAGLTVSGIAGSLMELAACRQLSFAEPFVSRRHVLRSLASAAIAGPLMLANDALAARREGRISGLALASCGATATIWSIATGTLLIDLVVRVPIPII